MRIRYSLLAITLGLLAITLAGGVHAASTVRHDAVLMLDNRAGAQTVEILNDGSERAEFSYNDRSHGDHITATWKLNAAGIPVDYQGGGVDYMKASIDEHFSSANDTAHWKTFGDKGEKKFRGEAFYLPANPPPEFYGVLARALLKAPSHTLALLPSGSASINIAGGIALDDAGKPAQWNQYRISGLDFMPMSVWLDRDGATAATASLWLSTIRGGHEALLSAVIEKQDDTNQIWFARIAKELTHVPAHDLIIRNSRLFDPRDLSVSAGTSVLVRGERIVRVAADAEMKASANAEIIDARGRFLMPGLWDNHQHFDGADGMLDIANGVTSARDMANDTHVFLRRVARFDAGTEIGPRVLKAGIIDGHGPNAGPFEAHALVDTAEQALAQVDWYADHGYAQIKTYMSLKPELVPIIADRAHARGLRLSGHVPAFMSARQFIEAGADEIQHFNYVELNFLYPEVKETTLMSERFIKVGEHAREFTPDKPPVREFIAFLKRHHTVLDPTMGLLEARLSGSADRVTPGLEDVAPRLPILTRRSLMGGAYEVPSDHADAYREAIPSMLKLLKALHDAGVTIVPGTDALSGYLLHHELELYARAGIAPAEVLRLATLTPAQVMGVDRDLGVIAAGKYADFVLIDGDPTRNIADIRNVVTVVKAGKVFDPRAIEKALGIAPRTRSAAAHLSIARD
jgi:imidazolonepropionase-like amidohydrolase